VNFKFARAHSSASSFLSLPHALAAMPSAATYVAAHCHVLLPTAWRQRRRVTSPPHGHTHLSAWPRQPPTPPLLPPLGTVTVIRHSAAASHRARAPKCLSTHPSILPYIRFNTPFLLSAHATRKNGFLRPPLPSSAIRRPRAATKGHSGSALAPRCFHTQPSHWSHSEPAAFQLFLAGCEQYHRW
jgi:hypothetical protein